MADLAPKLAKPKRHWTFVAAIAPREVFAVMEQLLGVPPYRYEVTGDDRARIVESTRKSWLLGYWRSSWGPLRRRFFPPRWVGVRAEQTDVGTLVEVDATADRASVSRALQLLQLLTSGMQDPRSVYRDRRVPLGPVTLVASWAGTPYRLFTEPDFAAARGETVIHTATKLLAVDQRSSFVRVRCADGEEGWVERDQIVAAPDRATRQAQERTASLSS